MKVEVSENTQAILLLTAPLLLNGKNTSATSEAKPLTQAKYRDFAIALHKYGKTPADLLASDPQSIIENCAKSAEETANIVKLLQRGFSLSQALEHWQARSIWVVSRADASYPKFYKERLGQNAPAIIYGCGDINLLHTGGLAVVGSRKVSPEVYAQTTAIGELAASSGVTIISGNAKGVDEAAMQGALKAGGKVCGVLADSLESTVMSRTNRDFIMSGQLVFVSAYDPKARFSRYTVMDRNKHIYALANSALVMNSDLEKGGTWAGAIEQLSRNKKAPELAPVPVYIRATGEPSAGLQGLREEGAINWPSPDSIESFQQTVLAELQAQTPKATPTADLFAVPSDTEVQAEKEPQQSAKTDETINFTVNHYQQTLPSEENTKSPETEDASATNQSGADALFNLASIEIYKLLEEPKNDQEIAEELQIEKKQAKAWLEKLVEEKKLKKLSRPVRYAAIRISDLFA